MRASEMLDLDRTMTPASQWEAEDSNDPVTHFKIPDTSGVTVEMLTADAHGAVTMRQLWRSLAKLLAACERRAAAATTCIGCIGGRHVRGCPVQKADADVIGALAAVHATGGDAARADRRPNGIHHQNSAGETGEGDVADHP